MSDCARGSLSVARFAQGAQAQKRKRLDFEVGTGAPQAQNECTAPTWSVLGAVASPMFAHIVELLGETVSPKRCNVAFTGGHTPVVPSRVQVAQTLSSLCRGSADVLLQHTILLAREELMPSVDWLVDAACRERKHETAFVRLMQLNLIVDETRRSMRRTSDKSLPLTHCGFQNSFDQRVATAVLVRMRVL